jgi:glycosyltransferase involved in cell wall biosynthesis
MKIVCIAHNLIRGDGQGRINYEIVRHALAKGHHVTLLADTVSPELIDAGAVLTPIRPRFRRPNLLKVRTFAQAADQAIRLLRSETDVFVGNGYVLREAHDVNLCQFVHGAWLRSPVHVSRLRRGPYGWYQFLFTQRNGVWERKSFGAARFVVAPSEKIRRELLEIGVPDERIRVIFNGVDPQEFHPGSEDRKSLGLPVDVPLGLFVGDIRTPRKNLDTVLKALVSVPAVQLAVVGSLDQSPFPAMAATLGVASRVHFLGFRRDVDRLMRACDFFAFPSRYEAGSLVLLEAMASGLPVLTAATAGGSELVGSACGVVLADPDDCQGLASAIRRVSEDADLRREMGAAARLSAEEHSWQRMAQRFVSLFEECRGEASGRQPSLCHSA